MASQKNAGHLNTGWVYSQRGVKLLTQMGHTVYVEHEAGLGAGFSDQEYIQAGARIAYTPHEVFGRADLLLKVTRPLAEEIEWLRPGVALAGLLHLGSSRKDKIDLMIANEITAIAYEQIILPDGTGPIRKPLSQIGGILAAQVGAHLLQSDTGGKGILLGGMPGVPPAEVVIIGAGVAGTGAAKAFKGMGAHLTVLDTNTAALEEIYQHHPARGDHDLEPDQYRALLRLRRPGDRSRPGARRATADRRDT